MSLTASIKAITHRPTVEAFLDGRRLDVVSAAADLGIDSVSSLGSVILGSVPSWLVGNGLRRKLVIRMGYDGFTIPVFTGFLEDDGRKYFPFDLELKGAGPLKQAQYQYPTEVTYASKTDTFIVGDLLDKAGIEDRDINGEGATNLGTLEDIVLEAAKAPWELINRLDQLWGYKTFDGADGVVRRRAVSLPSATAAFAYKQGAPSGSNHAILSISRPRTIRGIHNKVVVEGLPQATTTPSATRQAANVLVPTPPQYIAYEFKSDLIETSAIADTVAIRLMLVTNRVLEEVELEVPLNPYLAPGMTITIESAKVDLPPTPYLVRHVTHQVDERGGVTRLTAEGGDGDAGYLVTQPPVARFDYLVMRQVYDVAGVPTTMYTVVCDGSSSTDPDTPPDDLTFAWANNKNADVGTAKEYGTSFTQAEMDNATKPTITLTVTDPEANSDALTLTIDIDLISIQTRDIYVAAGSRAEATLNGGTTWRTWTPGGGVNVVSTPEIGGDDWTWFGLSDGKLYYTGNGLATTPTLAHTFAAQIECIFINPGDTRRVLIGLANGTVQLSENADLIAASTWTELYDFGASPVRWLWENADQPGHIRACNIENIYETVDQFDTAPSILHGWAGGDTAYKLLVGPEGFSNYGSADSAAAEPVQRDDGVDIVMPVLAPVVSDVRAISHHIRDDRLFAADLDTTTMRTFAKAADALTFTASATQTLAGQPNHMVADPEAWTEHYIACDEGLYKTINSFGTIVRMRDYTAAGLLGYQVGLGDLRMPVEDEVELLGVFKADASANEEVCKLQAGGWTQLVDLGAITQQTIKKLGDYHWLLQVDDASASPEGGLAKRSGDGGVTWIDKLTRCLDMAISADGTLWAIQTSDFDATLDNYLIVKSTDDGDNWTTVKTYAPAGGIWETKIMNIACHPTDANVVSAVGNYAVATLTVVYTTDGSTFTQIDPSGGAGSWNTPWYQNDIEVMGSGRIVILVYGVDAGAVTRVYWADSPYSVWTAVLIAAVAPTSLQLVRAGTKLYAIGQIGLGDNNYWYSPNGGASWTEIAAIASTGGSSSPRGNAWLSGANALASANQPLNPQLTEKVYQSVNPASSGATWDDISSNLGTALGAATNIVHVRRGLCET